MIARRSASRLASVAFVCLCGCAGAPPSPPGLTGKPIDEFFDDLKAELREVHWRIRSNVAACGST